MFMKAFWVENDEKKRKLRSPFILIAPLLSVNVDDIENPLKVIYICQLHFRYSF